MKQYLFFLSIMAPTMLVCSCCDKDGTTPEDILAAKYTAVDLGLSVKWADMDLGADNPKVSGTPFSWGELKTKDTFSESNYSYRKTAHYVFKVFGPGDDIETGKFNEHAHLKNQEFTEEVYERYWNRTYKPVSWNYTYELDDSDFTPDNQPTLLPCDDAAVQMLKNDWRMPTKAEFEELYNKCKVSNDVDLSTRSRIYTFTAPNGNSIKFISRSQDDINKICDHYWTSSLNEDNPEEAWSISLRGKTSTEKTDRFEGMLVRPVRKK